MDPYGPGDLSELKDEMVSLIFASRGCWEWDHPWEGDRYGLVAKVHSVVEYLKVPHVL